MTFFAEECQTRALIPLYIAGHFEYIYVVQNERDAVNKRMMGSADGVRQYAWSRELSPAEAAALEVVRAEARGRAILDIGVGAGRTVRGLREISEDYLGVDYTPEMIEVCKERYPGVRFEVGDARDMNGIESASIYLALFSCNGLGMVDHDDRVRILREIRRVLTPGGVFAFSTHNLASEEAKTSHRFRLPSFEPSLHPARLLVRTARFLRSSARRVANRRRLRPLEARGAGYAILNDVCHDYGVMLYYVDLAEQERQLREAGFGEIEAYFDLRGERTDRGCTDDSVMLLVRG